MADSQDALLLKKRARRRLIGAIALVLFVVIALPMVLDKEPRPIQNELSVQIPSQSSGAAGSRTTAPAGPVDSAKSPAVAPKADAPATAPKAEDPAKPETKAPAKADAVTAVAKSADPPKAAEPPKPAAAAAKGEPPAKADSKGKAAPAEADAARAKALLEGEAWIVPLGSFSSPDNVKQLQGRVAKTGIAAYAEQVSTSKGDQTRLRAGPFKTRDAAEKARATLKAAGIDAGAVAAR